MSTSKPFRPLLAATIENNEQLDALTYPMIASPKVDGIRCINHPSLGPITRSCKPIANLHIRSSLFIIACSDLDGELVSGPIAAPDVFNRTTSAVMTQSGDPEFMYHIFDSSILSEGVPYEKRLKDLGPRVKALRDSGIDYVKELTHTIVYCPDDVLTLEQVWLPKGFEGVMLRSPSGKYKQNRSTLKEQILLKLKRFTDAEAEVIGFEPLERNTNPQTRDLRGLAERSDHKAGKVQVETLGNLLVRDISGRFGEFSVGSGYDADTRATIWRDRERYIGKIIKYKFQEVGILEAPRFPIFLGFRED